ncbi:MAG: hypothetical protein HYR60_01775 [Acidobacteria bacterium]|nr:hypothetical protein [Acidobacteriota bacterium]
MAWPASRWSCISTVALVFLTGAVAGAVVLNLGGHKWMHQSTPFWTEAGKEISLQRWKRELDLTPDQARELETILDDFGLYYRNVVSEIKPRILKILNDEQKQRFTRLVGEAQHKTSP